MNHIATFRAQVLTDLLKDPALTSKARKTAQAALEADLRAIQVSSKITLDTCFDSIGHEEPWKNVLANDLNLLLHYARVSKPSFIPLALSLAARLAELEEIHRV